MLTTKQELFAQKIVEGMTQADAYRTAYSTKNMTDKSVWERASRIANDDKVKSRVEELREQVAKASIMTAQERLEWLTGIIKSEAETTTDKLRASDQMNKMQGEYVTKVEGNLNVKRLEDLL